MDQATQTTEMGHDQLLVAVGVMHEPVVVLDARSRIVMINDRLLDLTGFSSADLVGRPSRALFPAMFPALASVSSRGRGLFAGEKARARASRALSDQRPVDVLRLDGSVFAAHLLTASANSCAHGPIHVVTVRQVTQLTLDEIGLRGLLESAPDATLILDPNCRVVLANTRAANLLGRSRSELDGAHMQGLFAQDSAGDVLACLSECYERARHGDDINTYTTALPITVHGPQATEIPVEVAVTALRLQEGLVLRAALRDIRERLRTQQEAHSIKNHFFATVSHELRTPLTSVLGYTELLEEVETDRLSETGRQFLHAIDRNARRELRLVDDLLTLVTIGAGEMTLRCARVELDRVVEEAAEALEAAAQEAGVLVTVEGPPDPLWHLADAGRLHQALDNAISNAIKFSPPGGRVLIRSTSDQEGVTVSIQDQGPGIPVSEQLLVFERLYRGAQAIQDEKPGAGLGLTIVKAIVEAHGGKVDVGTSSFGGAQIDIWLPRVPAQ